MEKKQTRRESRETAFLTAFAATFEPETPLVPAETESAAPDAFATQLLAAMNDHAAELDEIITDDGAPQEELERIRSAGVKLTVVGQ